MAGSPPPRPAFPFPGAHLPGGGRNQLSQRAADSRAPPRAPGPGGPAEPGNRAQGGLSLGVLRVRWLAEPGRQPLRGRQRGRARPSTAKHRSFALPPSLLPPQAPAFSNLQALSTPRVRPSPWVTSKSKSQKTLGHETHIAPPGPYPQLEASSSSIVTPGWCL